VHSTFNKAHTAYKQAQKSSSGATRSSTTRSSASTDSRPQGADTTAKRPTPRPSTGKVVPDSEITKIARLSRDTFKSIQETVQKKLLRKQRAAQPTQPHLSIVEVSLNVIEAIRGVKKTIETVDGEGEHRKISVVIPPGAQPGSIIRFRRKDAPHEEVVLIMRVASHPFLSISHRGLTVEVPITVSESVAGARVQIPTLGEQVLVTIEPGTQSGHEVRLKEQGVLYRDGTRGDLIARFMVKTPELAEIPKSEGAKLKEKALELDAFYAKGVRSSLPRGILE
jgi:DnaJ-class molecular chaperone